MKEREDKHHSEEDQEVEPKERMHLFNSFIDTENENQG